MTYRTKILTLAVSGLLILSTAAFAVVIRYIAPEDGQYAQSGAYSTTSQEVQEVEHPGLSLHAPPFQDSQAGESSTVRVVLRNDIDGGAELPESVRVDIVTLGDDDLPYQHMEVCESINDGACAGTWTPLTDWIAAGGNVIAPDDLKPGMSKRALVRINWPADQQDTTYSYGWYVVGVDSHTGYGNS